MRATARARARPRASLRACGFAAVLLVLALVARSALAGVVAVQRRRHARRRPLVGHRRRRPAQRPRRRRPHRRPRRQRHASYGGARRRRPRSATRASDALRRPRRATRCSAAPGNDRITGGARRRRHHRRARATTSSSARDGVRDRDLVRPGPRPRRSPTRSDQVARRLRGRRAWLTRTAAAAGRPARRRRRRDPPHRGRGPRARGLPRRAARRAAARRSRPSSAVRPGGRSCSTSTMPDLDGARGAAAPARSAATTCRCACCRRATRSTTACAACRPAPTTTSSSRSRSRRSPRGCTRCCAAARPAPDEALRAGDLGSTRARTRARRGERDLELTRREFELLALFCATPARCSTAPRLHEEVWGYTFDPGTNVADVFVGYLRRKLEAGGEPRVLHTVRGVGFVLRP